MLILIDDSGIKLLTPSRDVRLEYTWPEISHERTVWSLAWDLIKECGGKQPDNMTLASDGNKLIQAQWSHPGIHQRL